MPTNVKGHDFEHVLRTELRDEIVPRRRAAHLADPTQPDVQVAAQARESLVGLSFSGGGIRAAAFCLGVLQALQAKRLMKFVDYLSTVSGGGYVGSLFSSLVNHPAGIEAWKQQTSPPETARRHAPVDSQFSLDSGPGGKQSELVRRLATSGPVLRRPLWFFSAYAFGLTLTNLVALPGLLAATILAAIMFRSLDRLVAQSYIGALGFDGDISRAFFPSFILLCLWLLAMVAGSAIQALAPLVRIARGLFVMMIVSVAMAIVALVGTGDIDVSQFTNTLGLQPQHGIAVPMPGRVASIVILGFALLPYLRVRELVRSGIKPENFRDRWIFAIASRALLYGVPLLLFGVFVSENISGFNTNREIELDDLKFSRSSTLYPTYVTDWKPFWQTVELSAKSPRELRTDDTPGKIAKLRLAVESCLWDIANGVDDDESERSSLKSDRHLHEARRQLLKTIRQADAELRWSWPTDNKEQQDIAASHNREPTIIDNEQSEEIDAEERASRSIFYKWWSLTGIVWPANNSIADDVAQRLRSIERDRRICDRLNYQFLANPHMAAALLSDLEGISTADETKSTEAETYKKGTTAKIRRLIEALDRSTAGAMVRQLSNDIRSDDTALERAFDRFINVVVASAANEVVSRFVDLMAIQKETPGQQQSSKSHALTNHSLLSSPSNHYRQAAAEYNEYLKAFPEWQASKHRLLYGWDVNWTDKAVDKSKLLNDIQNKLGGEKLAAHGNWDFETIEKGIREFNLGVLSEIIYPDQLQPQSTVFAGVVLAEDQRTRWHLFCWAAGVFLVAALFVNLNFSSIHSYYQQLLTKVWIVHVPGAGGRVPLVRLENTRVGAPYHLLHGTVSLARRDPFWPDFPRGGFLFSKRFCGSADLKYYATAELENLDLATAMSVSGAAITPSAVNNQLVWAIMFIANLRTGQWLAWPSEVVRWWTRALYRFAQWLPGMAWQVILDACLPKSRRSSTFVYDGGAYENLAVEPLLARRCRLIIAVDAGEDNESLFLDFQQLVQRARSRYGIRIEAFDKHDDWMGPLLPAAIPQDRNVTGHKKTLAERFAKRGFMRFTIEYPPTSKSAGADDQAAEPRFGTLIYIKPALVAELCHPDLLGYALTEPDFPQDATINQFYTPRQFDAYRALGEAIGAQVASDIFTSDGPRDEVMFRHCSQESATPSAGDSTAQRNAASPQEPELDDLIQKIPLAVSTETVGELVRHCAHDNKVVRNLASHVLLDGDHADRLDRQICETIANELLDRTAHWQRRVHYLDLIAGNVWHAGKRTIIAALQQIIDDPQQPAELRERATKLSAAAKARAATTAKVAVNR